MALGKEILSVVAFVCCSRGQHVPGSSLTDATGILELMRRSDGARQDNELPNAGTHKARIDAMDPVSVDAMNHLKLSQMALSSRPGVKDSRQSSLESGATFANGQNKGRTTARPTVLISNVKPHMGHQRNMVAMSNLSLGQWENEEILAVLLDSELPDLETGSNSRSFMEGADKFSSLKGTDSVAAMIVAGMVLVSVGLIMVYGREVAKGLAACALYLCFSLTIDVLIKARVSQGHKPFDPAVLVGLVEVAKLAISIVSVLVNASLSKQFRLPEPPAYSDVAWLSLPALLYAMNNIIVFHAIAKVDMSSFAVFRETMIIFSAAIWFLMFRIDIGSKRTIAVLGIMSSCILNQALAHHQQTHFSMNIIWVLLYAIVNAAASVSNEFAMKRSSQLDINVQNATFYSFCAISAFSYIAVMKPSRFQSTATFFEGFGEQCVVIGALQIFAGLCVSRVLKYADVLMKNAVSALRSPCLMVITAKFFGTDLTVTTVASGCLVSVSCFFYLYQGRIELRSQKQLA